VTKKLSVSFIAAFFVRHFIDAYTLKKKGEVCPTNWEPGKEAMSADRKPLNI
jgi:alkyl hydroperoxide reductase subunit AhpC